jgi:hypothetical protein
VFCFLSCGNESFDEEGKSVFTVTDFQMQYLCASKDQYEEETTTEIRCLKKKTLFLS